MHAFLTMPHRIALHSFRKSKMARSFTRCYHRVMAFPCHLKYFAKTLTFKILFPWYKFLEMELVDQRIRTYLNGSRYALPRCFPKMLFCLMLPRGR